jgi:hypothetical protein
MFVGYTFKPPLTYSIVGVHHSVLYTHNSLFCRAASVNYRCTSVLRLHRVGRQVTSAREGKISKSSFSNELITCYCGTNSNSLEQFEVENDGLELSFRKSAPHLLESHVYHVPQNWAVLWLSNGWVYVDAADRIINLVTNTVAAAVP